MIPFLKKIFLSRIALHLYFWLIVYLSFSLLYIFPVIRTEALLNNLIYLPGDILFTYFFLYVLHDLIIEKKQFFLFALFFILSIVVYSFVSYSIDQFLIPLIFGQSEFTQYNLRTFMHTSWVIVLIALAAGYLKMLRTWLRTDKDKIRLDLEKTEAYNQLLRSKINPHFLFNTLNNINSLVEIDKKKTRDSILRLADLMAYMVYDADTEMVSLETELQYIENFIALQLLRVDNENFVDYRIEGKPHAKRIASMLLIPFIENAFKFADRNAETAIQIRCSIYENSLELVVSNRIAPDSGDISQGGFGIENVKKRLNNLYPDNSELKITSENNEFIVFLRIGDLRRPD